MGDAHSWKPGTRPGNSPSPAKPTAVPTKPTFAPQLTPAAKPGSIATPGPAAKPATAAGAPSDNASGRVVHDERGNAVWDWLKDTARIAIDSTSRLLKKLEVPELKVEETAEHELRIEADRDAGGGYDPYGGSGTSPSRGASQNRTTNTSGRGPNTGPSANSRVSSGRGSGSSANTGNAGGGYDPYGKSTTNPSRKR